MGFRKAYWVKNILKFLTVMFVLLAIWTESMISWLFFVLACLFGFAMLLVTFKYWKCPACGKNLGGSKPTYCPHCSEKLDWFN